VVGLVLCGVQAILFPETQYEYFFSLSVVTTLPEVVYLPVVVGSTDSNPSPAVCLMVAGQVHPPPLAAFLQFTEPDS
jgi:hypothetical protein